MISISGAPCSVMAGARFRVKTVSLAATVIVPGLTAESSPEVSIESMASETFPATRRDQWSRVGQQTATIGFLLYSVFAPHFIVGAEIALAIAGSGWLIRTIATLKTGFRRTKLDVPIWLFVSWTILSSCLSEEPRISIAKLQSVCVFFLFYLTQAIVTRRTAVLLVCVMILSGVTGTLYSAYDLVRGRGVVIESLSNDSPFRETNVQPGDAVWRLNKRRMYSKEDIDEFIRKAPDGSRLQISVISRGEHVEWPSFVVTPQLKVLVSPSGIRGNQRIHSFRASGWTSHYLYFADILQILAQLALGLALANLKNHGANFRFKLATGAGLLLAIGIALTATRTVVIAWAIGACVIALRVRRGKAKAVVVATVIVVIGLGVLAISKTRAINALSLRDSSSSLHIQVARVGLSRIMMHPILGHGMDAVKKHWTEWGFPGNDMIPLSSTPLQLAFDRGLPALIFWLWIMVVFWITITRSEKSTRDSGDTNRYGLLLGASGALAGFFANSLVSHNFGTGIVALVFWWLMGVVVTLGHDAVSSEVSGGAPSLASSRPAVS